MTMRAQRRLLARSPWRRARAACMSVDFPFGGAGRFFKLIGRTVFPARFGEMEFGKRVVGTQIGHWYVSTVFLGVAQLDFRVFLGEPERAIDAPPLLFETMVLGGDGPNGMMQRYYTIEEAELGHAEICALLRGQLQATPDTRTLQ